MKKIAIGLSIVVVLGVGFLAGLSSGGFSLGGVGLAWNKDKALLEKMAKSFLEDLQYKDFKKASSYHNFKDQAKVDIPVLIERLFQVKPEVLNIRDIRITDVTLDSDGKRARTFFKTTLETLNTSQNPQEDPNEERQVEGILYWHRRPAEEAFSDPDGEGEDEKREPLPPSVPASEDGERWYMMLESSLH